MPHLRYIQHSSDTELNQTSDFFKAVRENNKRTVITLLDNGADCMALDHKNRTPLELAIKKQHWGIATNILVRMSHNNDPLLIPEKLFDEFLKVLGKERNNPERALLLVNAYRAKRPEIINAYLERAVQKQQWVLAEQLFHQLTGDLTISERSANTFLEHAIYYGPKAFASRLSLAIFIANKNYCLSFLINSSQEKERLFNFFCENEYWIPRLSDSLYHKFLRHLMQAEKLEPAKKIVNNMDQECLISCLQFAIDGRYWTGIYHVLSTLQNKRCSFRMSEADLNKFVKSAFESGEWGVLQILLVEMRSKKYALFIDLSMEKKQHFSKKQLQRNYSIF